MNYQEKREIIKDTTNEVNTTKLIDMYLNNKELYVKSYYEVKKQINLSKSPYRIDLIEFDNEKLVEHMTRFNVLRPILRNLELMLNINTKCPVDDYSLDD